MQFGNSNFWSFNTCLGPSKLYELRFGHFHENFIFANSVKSHICGIKNALLGHDLPISVNDRVISPFWEEFIFTKLRICEVSQNKPSRKFPN